MLGTPLPLFVFCSLFNVSPSTNVLFEWLPRKKFHFFITLTEFIRCYKAWIPQFEFSIPSGRLAVDKKSSGN